MNATMLITNLMFIHASGCKSKTSKRVLSELEVLKCDKKMPINLIKRAIKKQKKIIENLETKNVQ